LFRHSYNNNTKIHVINITNSPSPFKRQLEHKKNNFCTIYITMKAAKFAGLLAALVSVTSAAIAEPTPPPGWTRTGPTMNGNAFHKPALNEIVPANQPYNITWTPSETSKPCSIYLLRGPSNNIKYLDTIATGINNVGWFMWTPKQSLVADTTGYGLRIDVDGTQDYQYSTQFGISNSNPTPLNNTPGVKPLSVDNKPLPVDKPLPINKPLPVYKPLSVDNKPLPVDKPTTPTPGNPTVVYQTHYVTVTDCSCPTGVPSAPGYGTPGTPGHGTPGYGTPGYGTPGYSPAYPSGVPGKYHNTSITNTTYGGPAQYTGEATHVKAGGLLIAFAAGIVVLFL
jgi:hypothetical protein